MCHWDPRHRPLLGDGPYVARFQEKDLVWDQQFEFAVRDPSLLMTVAVFDAQHHDEFLGLVRVRVGAFRAGRWEDSPRCPLYVRRESRQGTKCRVRKRGTLLLAVRWQPKEPKQIFMRYIRPVIPEYWYLPAFHDNEIRLRGHQRQLRGYYLSHSDMRLPAQVRCRPGSACFPFSPPPPNPRPSASLPSCPAVYDRAHSHEGSDQGPAPHPHPPNYLRRQSCGAECKVTRM